MKKLLLFILFTQLSYANAARFHNDKTIYINGISSKIKWQKVIGGQLPPNAFVAFKNQNGPVYICQAYVSSGVAVGEVRDGLCVVADGNQVMKVDDFQVMLNHGEVNWLSMKDMYKYYSRNTMGFLGENSLPFQNITTENKYIPIIGGFTYISRYYPEMNYICRGMLDIEIVVGSVSRNKCKLTSGNEVKDSDMFQILSIRSE